MHVVVAVFALQTLLEQAFEQFATVSAHGGAGVRVQDEGVRDVDGRLVIGPRRAGPKRRRPTLFISRRNG